MTAYMISQVEVLDPAQWQQYGEIAASPRTDRAGDTTQSAICGGTATAAAGSRSRPMTVTWSRQVSCT